MRWTRATKAIVTGLAMTAAMVVPLAISHPAQAEEPASSVIQPADTNASVTLVSVSAARYQEISTDCRGYAVTWKVANTHKLWPGYAVAWRMEVSLGNPSHPEERMARTSVYGRGNDWGKAWVRMCGLSHSAGWYVPKARIVAYRPVDSLCNYVPAASISPSCSFAGPRTDGIRDRATGSSILLRRPTRITVQSLRVCSGRVNAYGRILHQTDEGGWRGAPYARAAVEGRVPGVKDPRSRSYLNVDGDGYFQGSGPISTGDLVRIQVSAAKRNISAGSPWIQPRSC